MKLQRCFQEMINTIDWMDEIKVTEFFLQRFSIFNKKKGKYSENHENSKEKQANRQKCGKTRMTKSWLVLVLHLIGWESGPGFWDQSQRKVKQNQYKLKFLSTVARRDSVVGFIPVMDTYLNCHESLQLRSRPGKTWDLISTGTVEESRRKWLAIIFLKHQSKKTLNWV